MKRTLCLFLALILAVGICFSAPVTITASAAEAADIIVTIDTDLSVTLKDADGDGYYDIGTADELYAFATAVNGGNTSINGELTANITINENVLTADGELNDDDSNFRVWTPIGKGSNMYIGTFDGGDNTVSGLYYNDSEYNGVGLFGYVGSAGNVKNVGVIDSYISGNMAVGGVAGSIDGSVVVINCYNTGTIVGKQYVGGVVGENFADVNECYNTGNVKGGNYVGGVVGYSSSNTSDCYNTGTIKGDNYVGGVVGCNKNGYVGNCYNTSNITATNACVGGVVGVSNCEVANCYFNNENFTGDAIGDSEGGVANNVEPKTVEQFASGEVAYLLQQGVEDEAFDRRVWGQKIGEDAFPVFATESNKVYKNQTGGCNEATYTYEYSNIEKASVTTHTPAENAIYTDNGDGTHSFECSVCVNTVIEDHTGGTAICTTLAVCENCGDSYGDFAPHTYINGKCTAEGCGYACAHENNKDENGICTVCRIAEGTCSENVTWIYDSKRTTLTISGTGGMTTTAPWKNYRSEIKTVVINNGVTTIGDNAFFNCTSLTTIEIPDSVTTIGDYAFAICTSLVSVTIPGSVTTIGECAFSDCEKLTSITIPQSVTTIGECAFSNCEKLTSITIPQSVTSIGYYAFSSCTELTEIKVAEGNTNYLSVDGILFNADKTELICYPAGKKGNYEIPTTVTEIAPEAFLENTLLESVTIPVSVTSIGKNAFQACSELTSVTIPESVTSIGNYAFSNCKKLILTVEPGSYAHNYAKTNSIPYIFNGYNEAETAQIEKLTFTLNADSESYSVTGCDTQISGELKIPATYNGKPVTEIGNYAFSACTALATVTIPDSVTTIGNYTFNACRALATVTIPDSVTTIGNYTFNDCRALATVTIGKDVTTIGDYAFNGCNKLLTVNVPCDWDTENPPYAFDENVLKKYHNIVIDEAVAATCTKTGLTEGQHCTRCDDKTVAQEVVPALNHKGTLVQVEAKAKTCTTVGWEAYEYCTACDYTTKVEIPASHELQEEKAKAPTCEAIGWDAYKHCTDCNYTTYVEKAKLGHDIVIDKAKAATCTATGLTEGSHCSRCDDKTVKQDIIPKKGHTEIKGGTPDAHTICDVCKDVLSAEHEFASKITTEPTYTKEGIKTFTCECGYSYEEVIPCLVPGEIKAEEAESNSFSATVVDINSIVTKLQLTDEEKALIEQGADMKIVFKLSDIGATINTPEKEAIFKALTNEKIAVFLDIQLVKQIANSSVNVQKLNDLIKVTVELPAELVNKDGNIKRSYSVLRYHDGDETKVTTLNAKFDEATGTLTFDTDRFSTYAIVYSDVVVSNGEGAPGTPDSGDGEVSTPETPKDETTPGTPETPKDETIPGTPETPKDETTPGTPETPKDDVSSDKTDDSVTNDKNDASSETGTNDKNDTSKDDVPKAGVISTTSIWLGAMALSGLGALLVSKKKKED